MVTEKPCLSVDMGHTWAIFEPDTNLYDLSEIDSCVEQRWDFWYPIFMFSSLTDHVGLFETAKLPSTLDGFMHFVSKISLITEKIFVLNFVSIFCPNQNLIKSRI